MNYPLTALIAAVVFGAAYTAGILINFVVEAVVLTIGI